jgi:hypothetical protein
MIANRGDYQLVTTPLYNNHMSPAEAAEIFRRKADTYRDMAGSVRDERRRRILHELFEENEAKAELLERVMHTQEGFATFRGGRRMN